MQEKHKTKEPRTVKIAKVRNRIWIDHGFHPHFQDQLREIGGVYNDEKQKWSISADMEKGFDDLIAMFFAEAKIEDHRKPKAKPKKQAPKAKAKPKEITPARAKPIETMEEPKIENITEHPNWQPRTGKIKKGDIHSAIGEVMRRVGIVTGTGHNKHFNFRFASEHDLLMAVQPAFAEFGISISRPEAEIQRYERIEIMRNGKVSNHTWHCMMWIKYRLVLSKRYAKKGADRAVEHKCYGAGEDNADKAIAKAQTMAFKYLLRQALGIPTGDDPDESKNSRG